MRSVSGLLSALALAVVLTTACASDPDAPEVTPTTSLPQSTRTISPAAATSVALPVATPTSTPPVVLPTATLPFTSAATGPSITISAVGDISLARQVNDWMAQYGAGYPYELVLPLLSGDIVFGNLEGALTDGGEPWPKSFNFRTPPQHAAGLAAAGFDVVALANNHAMDYGAVGLMDTIAALDGAGVRYVGGGDSVHSAVAWQIIDADGLRVAFIACAKSPAEGSGFTIEAWSATDTEPGLFVCSAEAVAQAVRHSAPTNDFVVVSIHAGDEYANAPNAVQRDMADAALAAGADVVLGHHAHVVQPVERRGNQLIVWGMGNFIFDLDEWDLAGIPEPRVAPVMQITLTKGIGVTSWRADAVVLDAASDRPRPATADEAAVLDGLLAP